MTLTPQTKKHKGAILVAIVTGAVVILGGGVMAGLLLGGNNRAPEPSPAAASAPALTTFTMKGAFTLFVASVNLPEGTPCKGTGLYDDMQEGAPVKVFNEAGSLLASGSLKRGTFVAPQGTTACKFEFAVLGVPDGPLKYGVAIGRHGTKLVDSDVAHSWVFFSDGP